MPKNNTVGKSDGKTGYYDSAENQTRALAADGVTWVKYEYDAANRLKYIRKDDAGQTLLQVFQFGSSNQRLIDYDPTGTGRNTFYATVGGTVLAEYTEYTSTILNWTKPTLTWAAAIYQR